ncbi:hypothetical protein GCM10025864_06270 [Luteimicrobium album]|uniref:Carbohydrate kinase FGGY N-terminal domain-containing protein n=1 Tax=Luteimicrobium album TaxID=1054550 RepID=A0ABQ6HYV1_9MICO|nr:hypothetical protein GCM10025864_06270 [Luteimicrobium album]
MSSTRGGGAAVVAVDLGATSGRVVVGTFDPDGGARGVPRLQLQHVARFPNDPVRTRDGLHWDLLGLYRGVLAGLTQAEREQPGEIVSVGVDSWAVDYALLRGGAVLGIPYHYRDERTAAGVDAVHAVVGPAELYARNGLQHLPFNTVFQLAADRRRGLLDVADQVLLVPDLLTYWLTGEVGAERTNASTTGLLDVRTGSGTATWPGSSACPSGCFRRSSSPERGGASSRARSRTSSGGRCP